MNPYDSRIGVGARHYIPRPARGKSVAPRGVQPLVPFWHPLLLGVGSPALHLSHRTNAYLARTLGAPVGFGDVADDLMTRFNVAVADADQSIAGGDWFGAVQGYQLAGQGAVTDLGPAIDARTNGDSKPLTGTAWDVNGLLANVNATNPTQDDATQAQAYARLMQTDYQTAMTLTVGGSSGASPVQPSSALLSDLDAVTAFFAANGCTQNAVPEVLTFQQQYNKEGQVHLKEDGKWGKASSGAGQRVYDVTTHATAAPSCFGSTVTPPKPKSLPATPPGGGLTIASAASMTPWLLGAAAVVAAAVVYEATKKKGGMGFKRHVGKAHRSLKRFQRHARRHARRFR